jgi:hypothetical protein
VLEYQTNATINMAGDGPPRKAYTLSWRNELKLGVKSGLTDDQRIDIIMEYLEDKATCSCYNLNNRKAESCHCLSCLDNEDSRNAVALYILWFTQLDKLMQQLLIMEKIRSTQLVLKKKRYSNQKLFFLPFKTELVEVTEALGDVTICQHAMMILLRFGRSAWATCRLAVENGTIPEHGLKGKATVKSKKFKLEVEPGLMDFFKKVVVPLSGPRPTRATAEESGAVIRDSEDTLELDPEWTKRRLYGKYCFDLGYSVTQSASGVVRIEVREDEEWVTGGAERGSHCSWSAFWNYWQREHTNIIVRKPSKDICGICYQFHIGNRKAAGKQCRNEDDSDDSEDEDDDEAIPTETERLALERKRIARDLETLATARMIKQHIEDSTSMRELCQKAMEDAKTATRENVEDDKMVITIVVDYCQNMEMPFFGKDQPGETYYYTPKTINLLGIVDCSKEKEILHAYAYSEEEGGKGGNNVASLIMKHLQDRGLLEEGKKRKQLNIVMDNCPGQNKNNFVLRLAPYLQEKGHFAEVNFIFLVAGHTKNVADRLFNTLKRLYRKQNVFTMTMLLRAMTHQQVIAYDVNWLVFKNWDKFLNRMYKKMSSVLKWQMFQSTTELGTATIFFKSSNVEDAQTLCENLKKPGIDDNQRKLLLQERPSPLYPTRLGLREIKQVELWKKYRPLIPEEYRDELCPKPAKEILDGEKNRKNAKSKMKRDEKKKKEGGKLKTAPSPPVVAAPPIVAAASTALRINDPTQLTNSNVISDNVTAPPSPSKRSREDAGFK